MQGEVVVGKPVKWAQKVHLADVAWKKIENGAVTFDVPNYASEVEVFSGQEKLSRSNRANIPVIEEGEEIELLLTYETPPLFIENRGEQFISISSIIPEEAFNITILGNDIFSLLDDNTKREKLKSINWTSRKLKILKNITQEYKNVSFEAPLDVLDAGDKLLKIEGESEKPILSNYKSGKISGISVSGKEIELISMPFDYEKLQGKAVVGKTVEWRLTANGTTVIYTTPPPIKEEEILLEKPDLTDYRKKINISSSVHYENIEAEAQFPEAIAGWAKLEWLNEETGEIIDVTSNPRFNAIKIDTDGNGKKDAFRFIVPSLSGEIFFIGGVPCVSNMDSQLMQNIGSKSGYLYREHNWAMDKNCTDLGADPGMFCYIANLSMQVRFSTSSTTYDTTTGAYWLIKQFRAYE